MSNVEILHLGEFEPSKASREFDAVSYQRFVWRGLLRCQEWEPGQFRIYIFPERDNSNQDYYAVKPGYVDDVKNEESAKKIIVDAIQSTFEHRMTTEVINDDRGGWISLETDT